MEEVREVYWSSERNNLATAFDSLALRKARSVVYHSLLLNSNRCVFNQSTTLSIQKRLTRLSPVHKHKLSPNPQIRKPDTVSCERTTPTSNLLQPTSWLDTGNLVPASGAERNTVTSVPPSEANTAEWGAERMYFTIKLRVLVQIIRMEAS